MRVRLYILALIALLWGSVEIKADKSHYNSNSIISLLDRVQSISEEAFNDRCFEEAAKYEEVISNLIPEDRSFANRVISNRSDLLLYAAQFLPIDSVSEYSDNLLEALSKYNATNSGEYKVLRLRSEYFHALSRDGMANDSVAEIVTSQIKQIYGKNSTEYANALVLKSVILVCNIPSILSDVEYKEIKRIKKENTRKAEKSIDQAISIYKSQGIPLEHTWPSYALALKERLLFNKLWEWHGGYILSSHSDNEDYGMASNVRNKACAQINSIYQNIMNSPDFRYITDAIDALDDLAEIHGSVHGHTYIEVVFLTLASELSNKINDIHRAQVFLNRAKTAHNLCLSESILNDSIFDSINNQIIQNKIRLAQQEDHHPLMGFEEALLTVGSPNYDMMKYYENQEDEYWFAPTMDSDDKNLNFSNLIRELIEIFSGSPFLKRDFLSQLRLPYSKDEQWNEYIEHPEHKWTTIWGGHNEEVFYFDNLNRSLSFPLERIYHSLSSKKNKSFEDYQNLSRCSFYLYDFEKAASYEQEALKTLLETNREDVNLIMECQKRMTYLLMLDLWYDIWLYSDASKVPSIYNEKIVHKMKKRSGYLKKHPDIIRKKLDGLIASAQTFSYEAMPYMYDILPNMGSEDRLKFWKNFSAWFYTIVPMLSFTPGMEEVIYDVQLFSKGLLLETSKTSTPKQYRWTDIREGLNSDEIAIEFIKSSNGYCAAVVESDSEKPQIIPLFTQSEYDSLSEDMGLYLSSVGHNLVFAPLALSDSISTIYFSPTGVLNTMAIESFCDESGSLASDKWNLVRLSTTKELITDHKKSDLHRIALYGGLDYSRRSFQDKNSNATPRSNKSMASRTRYVAPEDLRYGVDTLRWSLPEVTTIRDLYNEKFPLTEISLYTSDAGVEESVYSLQNKKPDIIHFSTHGYYWTEKEREKRSYISFVERANEETDNPTEQAMLFSGLFLSGANAVLSGEVLPDNIEDGVLTAKELSETDFSDTDFVALSACQTGLGALNGDGVFGLQRGFKLAGVKSLLMSLWPVNDKATELLMVEFYKNMLNGDSKHTALNKAKKYVMRYSDKEDNFSDPQYWAGWILLDALD